MFIGTKKRIFVAVGIIVAATGIFCAACGILKHAYVSALTSNPFEELDVKVSEALTFECTENGKPPKEDCKYSFELRDENKYQDGIVPVYKAENIGGKISFDYDKILEKIHDKVFSATAPLKRFDLSFSVKQIKGDDPNISYDETGYTIRIIGVYNYDEGIYNVTEVSYYKNNLPVWEQVRSISFNNYRKEERKAKIVVEETDAIKGDTLESGKVYTYTIKVRNDGNAAAEKIYIRRYMPEYSNFEPDGKEGTFDDPYDCMDDKESVRWIIDSLKEGESRSLKFSFAVNVCKPGSLKKKHEVMWEVVGPNYEPGVLRRDPANKI